MVDLITRKNDGDPIKNEGARVLTKIIFFKNSRASYSGICSKLVQDFIVVLVTCNYENDSTQNSREYVWTQLSPL